jgi:hypothetical protein
MDEWMNGLSALIARCPTRLFEVTHFTELFVAILKGIFGIRMRVFWVGPGVREFT